MKKLTHPVEMMANQINERGLMVFDNITRPPIYGKPHTSPFIVICLNHRGWLKTNYDKQPVEFHPHDLALVPPGHVLLAQETSDDYLASLLVISPRFLNKLSNYQPNSHNHIEYHYGVAFHLNDEQYEGVLRYFRMLSAISQVNHPERDELLANQMDVGAKLIEIYLQENGCMAIQEFDANRQLLYRFQNAIVKHFHESREVQYYAKLLCLSPKYFGSIIKQLTGIPANEWISSYVIVQAKSLLRYNHDLTIQQVSYQLGFPDPAAFTRYFKTNAGLSPKEYREQHNDTMVNQD